MSFGVFYLIIITNYDKCITKIYCLIYKWTHTLCVSYYILSINIICKEHLQTLQKYNEQLRLHCVLCTYETDTLLGKYFASCYFIVVISSVGLAAMLFYLRQFGHSLCSSIWLNFGPDSTAPYRSIQFPPVLRLNPSHLCCLHLWFRRFNLH